MASALASETGRVVPVAEDKIVIVQCLDKPKRVKICKDLSDYFC